MLCRLSASAAEKLSFGKRREKGKYLFGNLAAGRLESVGSIGSPVLFQRKFRLGGAWRVYDCLVLVCLKVRGMDKG